VASSTVENYVKQICLLQQESSENLVSMGRLAAAVGVAPGTATSMVKTLADAELVHYEPRTGVRLTKGGEQLALHVLRRHRLVELFLVNIIGLDWTEVHEEAEKLEHVVSDRLLTKIDALLHHPRVDPHGDPIPTAQGQIAQQKLDSLANCAQDQTVFVSRILDQDQGFLQFADRNGLRPGMPLRVERRDHEAEAVGVSIEGQRELTLGLTAASKILVQPEPLETQD